MTEEEEALAQPRGGGRGGSGRIPKMILEGF